MRHGSEVTTTAATLASAQQKIQVSPLTPLNLQLSLDITGDGFRKPQRTPSPRTLKSLCETAQIRARSWPSTPRCQPRARTVRRALETPRGRAHGSDPRWPRPHISAWDGGQLRFALYLFLFPDHEHQ